MKAIACIQKNPETNKWGIGYQNNLLFNYADDKKLFKQQTIGGICIMGRKTFESLKTPLKNRINIVLTKNRNYKYNKITKNESVLIFVYSYKELFTLLNNYKKDLNLDKDNIWIIGGEKIYFDLLPYCEQCILTSINGQKIKEADAFFPNLDELENWKCKIIQISKKDPLTFYHYINTKPKEFIL